LATKSRSSKDELRHVRRVTGDYLGLRLGDQLVRRHAAELDVDVRELLAELGHQLLGGLLAESGRRDVVIGEGDGDLLVWLEPRWQGDC
jgi:hypothetical protein